MQPINRSLSVNHFTCESSTDQNPDICLDIETDRKIFINWTGPISLSALDFFSAQLFYDTP